MSFNAIPENKILSKISESTVPRSRLSQFSKECLFELILYVPVKILSVMFGRCPGLNQY